MHAGLDLTSLLTVSSAAVMHHASDFSVELHGPAAPRFSELQGRDHRQRTRELERLRALPNDFIAAVGGRPERQSS